jgi:hypothetical protein
MDEDVTWFRVDLGGLLTPEKMKHLHYMLAVRGHPGSQYVWLVSPSGVPDPGDPDNQDAAERFLHLVAPIFPHATSNSDTMDW